MKSNRYLHFTEEMEFITTNIPLCSFQTNTETEEIYSAQIVDEIQGEPISEFNADFGLLSGNCEVVVNHEPPFLTIVLFGCTEGCALRFKKVSQ